jgi:molybdopterin molybdotransferase
VTLEAGSGMTTTPLRSGTVRPVRGTTPDVGLARARRAHGGLPWPAARAIAASMPARLEPRVVPLAEAAGQRLVREVRAGTELPPAAVAAMDGWATSGAGPWRVLPADARGRLPGGACAWVRTGAPVPTGTDRVVPVEQSVEVKAAHGSRDRDGDGADRRIDILSTVGPVGRHVRAAGEEARRGDLLLPAGALLTPPMLGLAAAGGADTVTVSGRAEVRVLILGDEIAVTGLPGPGRTRDALGPQLPAWLACYGVRPVPAPRHLPDDLDRLVDTLSTVDCDVLVTTGGTSVGDRDHVRRAVHRAGGEIAVDGVAVKPGHPMLLAQLPAVDVAAEGTATGRPRWLVALPGNPLAAAVAVVTLLQPLLAALHGECLPTARVSLEQPSPARAGDRHRLVPVREHRPGAARTVPACGPAMLRGLAASTGFAVIGPGGARAGDQVEYLELPWARPA